MKIFSDLLRERDEKIWPIHDRICWCRQRQGERSVKFFLIFIFLLFRHRAMHALWNILQIIIAMLLFHLFSLRVCSPSHFHPRRIKTQKILLFLLHLNLEMRCALLLPCTSMSAFYFHFEHQFYAVRWFLRKNKKTRANKKSQNGRKKREITRMNKYTFKSMPKCFIHSFCINFMRVRTSWRHQSTFCFFLAFAWKSFRQFLAVGQFCFCFAIFSPVSNEKTFRKHFERNRVNNSHKNCQTQQNFFGHVFFDLKCDV